MSDKTDTKTVSVTILDKEYLIACPEEERHDLIRSADYLDRKMREIRDAGKIIGSDRIAVMAALNISHELLTQSGESGKMDSSIGQRIKGLEAKIEDALYRSRQLEI
jgi:cell division protein ZapA